MQACLPFRSRAFCGPLRSRPAKGIAARRVGAFAPSRSPAAHLLSCKKGFVYSLRRIANWRFSSDFWFYRFSDKTGPVYRERNPALFIRFPYQGSHSSFSRPIPTNMPGIKKIVALFVSHTRKESAGREAPLPLTEEKNAIAA